MYEISQKMNNRSLATFTAECEGYNGGYLYSGETVTITSKRYSPTALDQRVHSVRQYDNRKSSAIIAHNKRILAAVEIGAVVHVNRSWQGGSSYISFLKTGDCSWSLVDNEEWLDSDEEDYED